MSSSSTLDSYDPADATPETVDRADLRAALIDGSNRQRVHGAKVIATLAASDPDYVEPLVPTIAETLGDDRIVVNRELASALASVANIALETLEPAVGPLVALLNHDVPVVRGVAAMPVRLLALERPDWFVPHADMLLTVLEDQISDPTDGYDGVPLEEPDRYELHHSIAQDEERRQLVARTVAAAVLVEVADREPTILSADTDRLVALVGADDPAVVGTVADVIGSLANAGIEVEAATTPLCGALTTWDHDDSVRARIVRALGYLEDPEAIAPLQRVAYEDDTSMELRELASETAVWLVRHCG